VDGITVESFTLEDINDSPFKAGIKKNACTPAGTGAKCVGGGSENCLTCNQTDNAFDRLDTNDDGYVTIEELNVKINKIAIGGNDTQY
jgi:hypothetical protein